MPVTATATHNGHDLADLPVLNPGGWFGKTWLLEIGGSFWPLFLIAEADSPCDAINELAESEEHGHHLVVADEDLGDYDPETCHYGPSGQVLDLDHLLVHGDESAKQPFLCRYFGDGLPGEGIKPSHLQEFEIEQA